MTGVWESVTGVWESVTGVWESVTDVRLPLADGGKRRERAGCHKRLGAAHRKSLQTAFLYFHRNELT